MCKLRKKKVRPGTAIEIYTCHGHGIPLQIDVMIIINSVSENLLYCTRNFGRSKILDKGGQLGPLVYIVGKGSTAQA